MSGERFQGLFVVDLLLEAIVQPSCTWFRHGIDRWDQSIESITGLGRASVDILSGFIDLTTQIAALFARQATTSFWLLV
jgi:hypothetical protein